MKRRIQTIVLSLTLVLGVGVLTTAPVGAINVFKACNKAADSEVCKAKDDSVSSPVQAVINTLLYAIGVVAVIMIIVGGLRYTMSNGDASRITSAKNTILYAVVGLVVAMLSFVIVNFVVAQIG